MFASVELDEPFVVVDEDLDPANSVEDLESGVPCGEASAAVEDRR